VLERSNLSRKMKMLEIPKNRFYLKNDGGRVVIASSIPGFGGDRRAPRAVCWNLPWTKDPS
jgi:hypothetical protein